MELFLQPASMTIEVALLYLSFIFLRGEAYTMQYKPPYLQTMDSY